MAEPGDLIGPYRLLARLGKGAMGDVWRARDERLDRHVALKLLPPDLAGDPERRARMLREARAAAGVGHGNVVTLYDVVSEGGTDVLVMELVDGQTLSETLRKHGPPPIKDAIAWLRGIAGALAAAHARGILHRDVKSANVMVTKGRAVKVLDFGLAKLRDDGAAPAGTAAREPVLPGGSDGLATVDDGAGPRSLDAATRSTAPRASVTPDGAAAGEVSSAALDATMPSEPAGASSGSGAAGPDPYQTRAGALLGTPMYMAPEQIAGEPPDERSEVFSVGVIAYELCAGRAPYRARAMDELFAQITHDPPPPLPDRVPAPLAEVVARALAKDPADRYAGMARARRGAGRGRARAVRAAALAVDRRDRRGHRRRGRRRARAVAGPRPSAARPARRRLRRARPCTSTTSSTGPRPCRRLRAALRIAPDHPRANAYMILFGGTTDDRAAAAAAAERAVGAADGKDRVLLETALALERRGPRAARAAITAHGVPGDRELAFWAAEMAFRAGDYDAAGREYDRLLDDPARELRGRIYDHDSAVLLYQDRGDAALRIGRMYRDAFPGEADAIGVYATTLAAAGHLKEALAAAEDARNLAEGEDTLAGLGKIYALSGDLARATALYRESMARAGDARRPIRRAALGLLLWMQGDAPGAREARRAVPAGRRRRRGPRARRLPVRRRRRRPRPGRGRRPRPRPARRRGHAAPPRLRPARRARRAGPGPRPLLRRRLRHRRPAAARARPRRRRRGRARRPRPARLLRRLPRPLLPDLAGLRGGRRPRRRGPPDRAAAALAPHLRPYRWWLTDDAARYRAK